MFKVILIDFGVAIECEQDELLDDWVGTERYMAPEVTNTKPYGYEVDVWGAGVVLRELREQFESRKASINQIQMEEDLLIRLLHPIPQYRITVEHALQHNYFSSLR